jgi:hypothetical protein
MHRASTQNSRLLHIDALASANRTCSSRVTSTPKVSRQAAIPPLAPKPRFSPQMHAEEARSGAGARSLPLPLDRPSRQGTKVKGTFKAVSVSVKLSGQLRLVPRCMPVELMVDKERPHLADEEVRLLMQCVYALHSAVS